MATCLAGDGFDHCWKDTAVRRKIIGDADLSNTVGWFTTHYPVHIKLAETWEPGHLLKQVKEQLRRVPNKGFGYSVLRYLRVEGQLASQPTPPVLFNYMGQFELALPTSDLFSLAQPLQGATVQSDRRTHDLEVNAVVRRGQLHLEVVFTGGLITPESVQGLIDGFRRPAWRR
jgi:non-ribosomal peptide synthase protein (TIGR01720 family)